MSGCSSLLFLFLISCLCIAPVLADEDRKAYIVYMGALPEDVNYLASSHHKRMLQSVMGKRFSPENSLIRSYDKSFNGFAAELTETEKEKLKNMEDVVSVFPDRKMELHTTRSWDFAGFPLTVKRIKAIESDIIIGVLDTGVWPESESFNDEGFGPIPKKWKGNCSKSFPCNKKLIGATGFLLGKDDPRDYDGHGTHTASTAAGGIVHGANFYGFANGTARGGVPSSRIAAYQVCDHNQCYPSAILAAFDKAIKDGVDIITVSLGSPYPSPILEDPIAIGSFHAAQKGILTTQSAGNDDIDSTSSTAPWLFSVGAALIDRRFITNITLGNGKTLIGSAVNSDTLKQDFIPLVYGKDATLICNQTDAMYCADNCLDAKLVKGKIVLCDDDDAIDEARRAGAVGSIAAAYSPDVSDILSLPFSGLGPQDYNEVASYYNSSKSPLGKILKTEVVNYSAVPIVASFSSTGPNSIAHDILKPDVSAPGVDILAAYSPKARVSTYPNDTRSVNFSIMSGTSMSCPHVAGASAYVKSFHPTWSPSAIKSAIMTTALPMSAAKDPHAEFAYGSGFLNPAKAVDPGLVYETDESDYVNFLCKIGYNATLIRQIVRHRVACPKDASGTSPADLNYPSMAASVNSNKTFTIEFQRRVTNVGAANSTYKAVVASDPKLKVKVEPSFLSFSNVNEKKWFNVTVIGTTKSFVTASLTWSDGTHKVRSPIVVYQLDTLK